jgi:hypothetical protein
MPLSINLFKPIILLIASNDKKEYLPDVWKEIDEIREILRPVCDHLHYELEVFPYTSISKLIDFINTNKDQLVLIHFAGHSSSTFLKLDQGEAYSLGLSKKLASCAKLKLLFLNGCNNTRQVQLFINAGVPAVLGTTQSIIDDVASLFSKNFYKALSEQGLNVSQALIQAKDDIESTMGQPYRSLDLEDVKNITTHAWFLTPKRFKWTLASAANPCDQLPQLPRGELPANPFKNLYYYREEDAEIFFGRCQATLNLLQLLKEPEPLILLHGGTGVGKSSFLQAGFIPRLKTYGQNVHYFRYSELREQQNLLEWMFGSEKPEDISKLLHSEGEYPNVWILDQAEEMFTTNLCGRSGDDIPDNLKKILGFIYNIYYEKNNYNKSNAKFIFSLRTEWYGKLHNICSEKYDINYRDLFLDILNRKEIIEIIESISVVNYLIKRYRLIIINNHELLSKKISSDLLEDKESSIAPILQVILSRLWEAVKNNREKKWDDKLYIKYKKKGLLLSDYLKIQLDQIENNNTWGKEASNNGLILDVLSRHMTDRGTSKNLGRSDCSRLYPHISYIHHIRKELRNKYLLIEPQTEGNINGDMRISHDTLAILVKNIYDHSYFYGPRSFRILEYKKNIYLIEKKIPLLDSYDLICVKKGINGTSFWKNDSIKKEIVRNSKRKKIINIFYLFVFYSTLIFFSFIFFRYIYYSNSGIEKIKTVNTELSQLVSDNIRSVDINIIHSLKNEIYSISDSFISHENGYYKYYILSSLEKLEMKKINANTGVLDSSLFDKAINHSIKSLHYLENTSYNFIKNKNSYRGSKMHGVMFHILKIYSMKYCPSKKHSIPRYIQVYFNRIPFAYINKFKDKSDECLIDDLRTKINYGKQQDKKT